jgi:hypothetical protein
MEKRKRVRTEAMIPSSGGCAVCGTRDARVLMMMELPGGAAVTLCGSHALMQSRLAEPPTTVAELRAALIDRRAHDRRTTMKPGDELGERLTAAFLHERRSAERRAG